MAVMSKATDNKPVIIVPNDEYNRQLVNNVHPPGWVNPEPTDRYNMVVIGAGAAGLVTAAVAASLGAKVALIEKYLMGGDCLNVGCVPSKGIIRASRIWAQFRNAESFGVQIPEGMKYDFAAVMTRMRRLRAQISHVDSAHRFKSLGVDLFIGEGRFTGADTVSVGGKTLMFANATICTGARASTPPIPGLREVGYQTNDTIFTLTNLPPRLAVIGAGPIGCEMGQAFARLGSQVTIFLRGTTILPREDADAAKIVQQSMVRDGVCFITNSEITGCALRGKEKIIQYNSDRATTGLAVDEILVCVGRTPNVEGLGLEIVGVAHDSIVGVKVNEQLQTTHPRIFAACDICSSFKFTHVADAMAQIVIRNALFPHPLGLGYARTGSLIIPWCTYTDPEIAHVGMYESDARAKGIDVETFIYKLSEVDRAILNGEEEGFARIDVRKGTDSILGGTVVASHAGEMISEISLAMQGGLGLKSLANTIHPYPTEAEVIKKAANAWRKKSFTKQKKQIISQWFSWTR
jgi:pyruvate/2-oxoglutarate dehydrogenase complex dihydrolipoamide dehydrogenase (E3) component